MRIYFSFLINENIRIILVIQTEIQQERYDFWSRFLGLFLPFFSLLFLGGKRKGEKNNKSRYQKSCLSARSWWSYWVSDWHIKLLVHRIIKSLKIPLKEIYLMNFQFPESFLSSMSTHFNNSILSIFKKVWFYIFCNMHTNSTF